MKKTKKLYLQVTTDKFRLPIFIADSPGELAQMTGSSVANILSTISHTKERHGVSKYEVVEYDAEEYEREMRQYYEN